VKPPPGPPAMVVAAPTTCAVLRVDGILAAFQAVRDQLVHVEELENAGITLKPNRMMRRRIEKRMKDLIPQLAEWTAQE